MYFKHLSPTIKKRIVKEIFPSSIIMCPIYYEQKLINVNNCFLCVFTDDES